MDQAPYGGGTWFDHRQGLRCCNARADMCSPCHLLALTHASPAGTMGGTGPDGTGTALQEKRPALLLQGRVWCLCPSSSRPSHCFHPMYHPHSSQLRLLRCTPAPLSLWGIPGRSAELCHPLCATVPVPWKVAHLPEYVRGRLLVEYKPWNLTSSVSCTGELWMACSSTCICTCSPSAQADAATGCYFTWWACGYGS